MEKKQLARNKKLLEAAERIFDMFEFERLEEMLDNLLWKAAGNLSPEDTCDGEFETRVFENTMLRKLLRDLNSAYKLPKNAQL